MSKRTWHDKAHEIIGQLSRDAWLRANMTKAGRIRRRHVPYSLPFEATELVDCLATDDEIRAKCIFLSLY